MIRTSGHGSDAVADHRNAKARWAATHRAICDLLPDDLAGSTFQSLTSGAVITFRCMDGIDILHRQP
jgi:hypothetical protein